MKFQVLGITTLQAMCMGATTLNCLAFPMWGLRTIKGTTMFSSNIKRMFRSAIKAANAARDFVSAATEFVGEAFVIYKTVRGFWA